MLLCTMLLKMRITSMININFTSIRIFAKRKNIDFFYPNDFRCFGWYFNYKLAIISRRLCCVVLTIYDINVQWSSFNTWVTLLSSNPHSKPTSATQLRHHVFLNLTNYFFLICQQIFKSNIFWMFDPLRLSKER